MPVYYRSDTRSPEEIFKQGMQLRPDSHVQDEWWQIAIQLIHYENKDGVNYLAIDAIEKAAVCLSTKFESTAIFPLSSTKVTTESYVYAISLPEAIKIEYEENERPIYFRSNLPGEQELQKYKNMYIITLGESNKQLNYIDLRDSGRTNLCSC